MKIEMKIEQIKEAATPGEMRAEIFRLTRHDAMVNNVMRMTEYSGASAEDRYTILAYYALRDRAMAQQMVLDNAMTRPMPPMAVTPNAALTGAATDV